MRRATLWLVQQGDPDDLIPVSQAAKLIGVDRQTIYNAAKDGRLRSWSLGIRRKLVSRAEVMRLGRPRLERPAPEGRASEAG